MRLWLQKRKYTKYGCVQGRSSSSVSSCFLLETWSEVAGLDSEPVRIVLATAVCILQQSSIDGYPSQDLDGLSDLVTSKCLGQIEPPMSARDIVMPTRRQQGG
jgi:hypothetical protein